jgi:hypothetical protein
MIVDDRNTLFQDILRGRISRRDLARRAAAVGVAGAAVGSLGGLLAG